MQRTRRPASTPPSLAQSVPPLASVALRGQLGAHATPLILPGGLARYVSHCAVTVRRRRCIVASALPSFYQSRQRERREEERSREIEGGRERERARVTAFSRGRERERNRCGPYAFPRTVLDFDLRTFHSHRSQIAYANRRRWPTRAERRLRASSRRRVTASTNEYTRVRL